MRIILKIIALPFIIILTPTVPLLTFIFCHATSALNILSGIGALAGALRELDADTLTPLEALGLLYKWKKEIGNG